MLDSLLRLRMRGLSTARPFSHVRARRRLGPNTAWNMGRSPARSAHPTRPGTLKHPSVPHHCLTFNILLTLPLLDTRAAPT